MPCASCSFNLIFDVFWLVSISFSPSCDLHSVDAMVYGAMQILLTKLTHTNIIPEIYAVGDPDLQCVYII